MTATRQREQSPRLRTILRTLGRRAFCDYKAHKSAAWYLLVALASGLFSAGAEAQPSSRRPSAVGAQHQQMTETDEFIRRSGGWPCALR